MKCIAWDTSTKTGALVAFEIDDADGGCRVVAEWTLNVSAAHSERLLWAIDQLLAAAGWSLEQIERFGVGVGPGSFTGLRIGLTTARTLAHAQGKPLIGVSSLAVRALPAARECLAWKKPGTRLVVAEDACKGEVFALWGQARALARCIAFQEGRLSSKLAPRGVREAVLTPEELAVLLRQELSGARSESGAGTWAGVGTVFGPGGSLANAFSRGIFKQKKIALSASADLSPSALAWRVTQALSVGAGSPALEITPRYLRDSDAQVRLRKGLLRPQPLET